MFDGSIYGHCSTSIEEVWKTKFEAPGFRAAPFRTIGTARQADRWPLMIVRLVRPVVPRPDHLVLYAPGVADVIYAPPDLLRRMEGFSAYFHAERAEDGWDILERAEDPGWVFD